MEQNPQSDKYLRAKIEEPNLRLPKNLLKPGSDPTDDIHYLKIYEDDNHKAVHLYEAVASGAAEVDRKVYRMRNKEVSKLVGRDDDLLKNIHSVSKATIGLLSDSESVRHRHSYLDLLGSVEQVRTAEELILDAIIKTYVTYPIILMPPTLYGDKMIVPLDKVGSILGKDGNRILELEIETGTWIKIDPLDERKTVLVNVYGPESNVINAMSLMESLMSEDFEETTFGEEAVHEGVEEATLGTEAQHKLSLSPKEGSTKMEEVLVRDKRKGKAIVDETDNQFQVPQSMPTLNSGNIDALFYKPLETQRKVTELAHTDSSADGLQKKIFLIRNKEVDKVLGKENERIKYIRSISGATIGLIFDERTKIHDHSFLELLGTPSQVKIAELLIVDAITETYNRPCIPPALMPPNNCYHSTTIPLCKSGALLGINGNNILKMEMLSGAWIEVCGIVKVNTCSEPYQRVVKLYGDQQQITSALLMIQEPQGEEHVELRDDSASLIDETTSAEERERKKSAESEKEKQLSLSLKKESKKMDEVLGRDKRKGKAIAEETDHQFRVPKSVPNFSNNKDDARHYIKLFGTQKKTAQSSHTDSSAQEVEKKLFRIRNIDLNRVLGKDDARIKLIQTKSKATIGILLDMQIKIHRQSYLELSGTPDQVTIAELLIVDAITETYDQRFIPTALMPMDICHYNMTFPIYKAARLLGMDGNNVVRMEMQSGAWIELDTINPPPDGEIWERVVMIYGDMKQITKAVTMIQERLSASEEPVISYDWDPFFDDFNSFEEEEYKQRAELEDEKWQHDEEEEVEVKKKAELEDEKCQHDEEEEVESKRRAELEDEKRQPDEEEEVEAKKRAEVEDEKRQHDDEEDEKRQHDDEEFEAKKRAKLEDEKRQNYEEEEEAEATKSAELEVKKQQHYEEGEGKESAESGNEMGKY